MFLIFSLLFTFLALPASSLQATAAESTSAGTGEEQADNTASADTTTITISAVGDCTLGKNYKMSYKHSWGQYYARKGASWFLKKTSSVFKKDDLTIANLEGVLSSSAKKRVHSFYKERDKQIAGRSFFHLGKPKYLKALKSGGVDVVTFANNHNIDYGLKGFRDTVNACRNYKMPIAYYDTLVRYQVKGIQIGVIAVDQSYLTRKTAEKYLRAGIASLKEDCQLIVACMHWGQNYKKYPDKDARYLGHLCVNLGADMVIGAHPHILQGVERYRGRYIYYSLGNFTYGGRLKPKDADTMIVQQTFTFVNGKLQIDDNVRLIPCWISGSRKVSNYQPVIKKGAAGRKIIRKINTRSKKFGMKFDYSGKPVAAPAADTKLPENTDKAPGQKPKKIPSIIYKLLRKKK